MERVSVIDNRFMIRRDLPEILEINADNFECNWDEEDFLRSLRSRNTISRIAEVCGKVAGYIIYQYSSGQFQIINLAVSRQSRRLGVGSALLVKLISKPREYLKRVQVNVAEANLPAQLFFRSHGFKAKKVLRGHFGSQDAYVMVYRPT